MQSQSGCCEKGICLRKGTPAKRARKRGGTAMGLRFRRTKGLGGGVRLNISKSGIGISGGMKGARMGIGPRGLRTSIGVPGTGLHYVTQTGWGSSKWKSAKTSRSASTSSAPAHARSAEFPSASAAGFAPNMTWAFIVGAPIAAAVIGGSGGVVLALCLLAAAYIYSRSPAVRLRKEYQTAVAKAYRGNYTDAVSLLTKIEESDSSSSSVALALAHSYYHLKSHDMAAR